jgi:DNA polymerase-3 subunit gamma/tau
MFINSIGTDTEKKNDLSVPTLKAATVKSTNNVVQNTVKEQAPVITETVVKAVVAPVAETVATMVKKPLLKTATPSISQHLSNEKKTDSFIDQKPEQVSSMGQPQADFNFQALETVWNKYANDLKEKGKTNLATALLSKQPLLKENAVIEFAVNNKALEESINEDKSNFLGFLRKALNNYSIQLNLVLTAAEDKTNLYTAGDRYKRLAEKNPIINKFRQAFDLDLEF